VVLAAVDVQHRLGDLLQVDLAAAELLRLELELFLAELDLRLAQGEDIELLAAAF